MGSGSEARAIWADPAGEATLRSAEFERLSAWIEAESGIRTPPAKQSMLECRLRRRLRALGIRDFADYCALVLDRQDGPERVRLLDEVTTNKTDFFREPQHFSWLAERALPELLRGAGSRRELSVWSAACSSGEEPYTIAMVLAEEAARPPGFAFRVLATDLSTQMVVQARGATWPAERAEPVPLALRQRYLLRSKDGGFVRAVPALRERVTVARHNLLDQEPPAAAVDVLFCRNVLIYFDRGLQERVLRRLSGALSPGGYLFLGHSETIYGLDLPLEAVAPTVYRKRA